MASPSPVAGPWLARRLFPLLATAGLLAVGMTTTTWWGPGLLAKHGWKLPHDLWGTLVAARRLAPGCRRPVHPSHRPDQPARRRRDPGPGRRRHRRRGTVAAGSWPAQSPSGRVAVRRALPDHRVGGGPVRSRCDRRGPGRTPAQARPARRRGRGGTVGRLGAMGVTPKTRSRWDCCCSPSWCCPGQEPDGPAG